MAIAKFLEGTAFGVMNDILAGFRSNEGYAIPNRYEVIINPPTKVGGGGQENIFNNKERGANLRDLSLRVESVVLPGRTLTTVTESNVYGPDRDIVEGVTYADEIAIDFQASSGLDERVFFENWQRQAFNEKTWNIGFYNDYVGSMEIYLLDRQDVRRYGIKCWEVFPKTITANTLTAAEATEIIKTNVSFSFRYWSNIDQNQQGPNVMDRILETVANSAERNISRNIPRILNRL
jgi:hypothetical protein|tara:strand:- start:541 stop:1245 length:705 start_codon:yes stop_codon:yes gene_type:complete